MTSQHDALIMMASSRDNVGFEIGGQATEVAILVLKGAKSLLKNKVKRGADARVAAEPVGHKRE